MPKLLFRQNRERWDEQGSKALAERAEERAKSLMENDVENGMSEDQLNELDRLANRFLNQVMEED